VAIIPWIVIVFGSVLTVYYQRKRLTSVVTLSVVGLVTSLSFIYLSAPDLGLTQISVEVVTILLILLSLYVLPQRTPNESSVGRRTRDAVVAIAAGTGVTALAWSVFTRPADSIAHFYLEKSVPEGGGTNVVNVILVDFRGFDTMGEIAVLTMAAIGIVVMLKGKRPEHPESAKPRAEQRFPTMLTTTTRPLLALILLVAVYIFMRGHNLPGGGFIAGLVGTVALLIQYVASGINWTNERLRINFERLCAVGVIIAVSTGLGSWVFGYPFLTSSVAHVNIPLVGEIHLASAIPFDLGVFFVVVGSMLIIIKRLSEYQRSEEVINSQKGRS
jgi:multicomponent K+:H+ antiporter subunit A